MPHAGISTQLRWRSRETDRWITYFGTGGRGRSGGGPGQGGYCACEEPCQWERIEDDSDDVWLDMAPVKSSDGKVDRRVGWKDSTMTFVG